MENGRLWASENMSHDAFFLAYERLAIGRYLAWTLVAALALGKSPRGGAKDVQQPAAPSVAIWWIPLGAGGRLVAFNGRLYERLRAWRERRAPQPLYHSALEVTLPEGRFIVENAWPVPDEHGDRRGVVRTGPVFSRRLGRLRALRYEVRCWKGGTTDDAQLVASKPVVSRSEATARRVIELAPRVPVKVWGRDEDGVGEMWSSNSVIAWILVQAGLAVDSLGPPGSGRAPGWRAGAIVAERVRREPQDQAEPSASPWTRSSKTSGS